MKGAIDSRKRYPFTMQVFHEYRDDNGTPHRGVGCFQGEGRDLAEFFKLAEACFKDRPDVKFGAVLPGHHERIP